MPEVVEVNKYANFLTKNLKGQTLLSVKNLKGKFKLKNMSDVKFKYAKNKGKFLYVCFSDDVFLICSLGLTGGFTIVCKDDKYHVPKLFKYPGSKTEINENSLDHLRVEFNFTDVTLYYFDTIQYGSLKFVDKKELQKKLDSLGPDVMDCSEKEFAESLQKSKKNKQIGVVIVDQKIISGIGNRLRAEILWLSKISPFRLMKDVTEKEMSVLYKKTKQITSNQKNYIYNQEEDPNGNNVKKEVLYEGTQKRFIHWVPDVQK